MAEPSRKDYESWERIKKKTSVGLLEDGSPKRKMDENLAKAFFRSAVRKKWMHCNAKLNFLESSRAPDTDPTTRRKWKYQCAICEGWFNKDCVDVDHIEGEKSFTEWSQAGEYASSILDVGRKDLQLLCNDESGVNCHATKSTCERIGVDWRTEEGRFKGKLEQKFHRLMDGDCKKAQGQKDWITKRGYTPASNATLRREQIFNILKEESK